MYTYGQPRTGNLAYAQFINKEFGFNAFRGEHKKEISDQDSHLGEKRFT
jgi:hypothetical protein